nr:MAG TPA: hypothetical protein [Caudoviricetes sp.]
MRHYTAINLDAANIRIYLLASKGFGKIKC